METDLIVFDGCFDATLEQALEVIKDYLNKLVEVISDAVLNVDIEDVEGKKIWRGKILESKDWGEQDLYYGYIEVYPLYVNSDTPIKIKLYCSHPKYISYWSGVCSSINNRLKVSDGSPGPTNELWNLVADRDYDRKLLELSHKGYTAIVIGERIGISPSRVYGRLGELRKQYGVVIVPYKSPWKKRTTQ